MPNYSLLINSQFKPYSFEELIKPYQIYGEAYKEMESAYNTLGTTAGALESILNDERDPIASGMYKNYMQGLNNAADELATKGLSPSARTNINNLTKQYATSIVPIQKAAETWQKQIEEQRKNGDSKINSYNANTLSIDKFLENPQLSYDTIDKGTLMKTSTAYFSQMAKQARDIQTKKLYDKSGKYTYERDFVEEYGATPEEVISFQNDMERALQTGDANAVQYVIALHPELGNIADKLFKGTKAANWDPNSEGVAETWNTIIGSSVAAMGETKHNLRQDAVAVHSANAATDYYYYTKKADDEARRKAEEEARKNNNDKDNPNMITKNALNVINPMSNEAKEWVKNGYLINTNGVLSYNQSKKEELSNTINKAVKKYNLSQEELDFILNAPYATRSGGVNQEYINEHKDVFNKLTKKGVISVSGGYGSYINGAAGDVQRLSLQQKEFEEYLMKSLNLPEQAFTLNSKNNNVDMFGRTPEEASFASSLFGITPNENSFNYTKANYNMPYLDYINKALANSDEGKNVYNNYEYEYKIADSDIESVVKQMSRDLPNNANFETIELSNNGKEVTYKSGSIYPSEIKKDNKENGYKPISIGTVYTDKGPVAYVKCETKDHKKILVRISDDKIENNMETIALTQKAAQRAIEENNYNAIDIANNNLKEYEGNLPQTIANWYIENKAEEQVFKPKVQY